MAKKLTLEAQKRKILGRKVRKLRREGVLPANLYGKKIKSVALELPLKDFLKVFEEAGETSLIDLKTDGQTNPVLIHNVQFNPITETPIHIDFHQVSLTEKTRADIPIDLVGESLAVAQKIGILIQPLAEVGVEALPADLPDRLTVNISGLKEINDAVTVGDLKVDEKKVEVLAGKSEVVAKIEAPAKEEVAPPPPTEGEEAAPVEGEEVPAEAEVGVPAEGKPVEKGRVPEGKPEEKTQKPEGDQPPKPQEEKKK